VARVKHAHKRQRVVSSNGARLAAADAPRLVLGLILGGGRVVGAVGLFSFSAGGKKKKRGGLREKKTARLIPCSPHPRQNMVVLSSRTCAQPSLPAHSNASTQRRLPKWLQMRSLSPCLLVFGLELLGVALLEGGVGVVGCCCVVAAARDPPTERRKCPLHTPPSNPPPPPRSKTHRRRSSRARRPPIEARAARRNPA
jgi:hypothetical protein